MCTCNTTHMHISRHSFAHSYMQAYIGLHTFIPNYIYMYMQTNIHKIYT